MIQDERASVLQRELGAEPGWEELYLLGGIAAIVLVAVMMLSVGLFIVWPNAPGVTATVRTFHPRAGKHVGRSHALDLGVSLSNLVSILLYLALYVALRQINRSFALIALAFGLVAVASLIAARPVLRYLRSALSIRPPQATWNVVAIWQQVRHCSCSFTARRSRPISYWVACRS